MNGIKLIAETDVTWVQSGSLYVGRGGEKLVPLMYAKSKQYSSHKTLPINYVHCSNEDLSAQSASCG